MSRHEITIERLAIRLKGGDANDARKLSASIGYEALQQIAQQISVPRGRRLTRIAQIDAGTLRLSNASQSPSSRATIAGQIARSVSSKIAAGSSGQKR
jgi:hypothetical protein